MVEWSILALLIFSMAGVMGQKLRVVQAQAELAAVKSTLGALRTAFVLAHLQRKPTSGGNVEQHNPFELLERRPINYHGQLPVAASETIPAGAWAFDPVCDCVGYRPMATEWFESPNEDFIAWYQVTKTTGPLQLISRENYLWQGQPLN